MYLPLFFLLLREWNPVGKLELPARAPCFFCGQLWKSRKPAWPGQPKARVRETCSACLNFAAATVGVGMVTVIQERRLQGGQISRSLESWSNRSRSNRLPVESVCSSWGHTTLRAAVNSPPDQCCNPNQVDVTFSLVAKQGRVGKGEQRQVVELSSKTGNQKNISFNSQNIFLFREPVFLTYAQITKIKIK